MLKELHLSSVEELFSHLPDSIRLKDELKIPPGISEDELGALIKSNADKNTPLSCYNSFLGGGLYFHYLPAALKHLLLRSEFYTAYTPYQAECSQGVLQAIYEYQTYMCMLTGMEVSNASLYDGASSLAEAVLMSLRINKRKKVLIAESVHPEYREVLKTYLKGFEFTLEEIPFTKEGMLDINKLRASLDEATSCLAIQTPNFFGLIEDTQTITQTIKEKGVLSIVVTNPFSLSLLKELSLLGADIVCGDGQPLGSPLSLGGPAFGFLTTKKEFMRQLPGRIVGKTKDREGNDGFCLTLQAREQHIRREKATSNICSNQSLNAIGAAIYLSLLGKEEFRRAGTYALNLSHYCYEGLGALPSVSMPFSGRFFNEFIWHLPQAEEVWQALYGRNIICGILVEKFYPQLKNCILTCCTERKTKEEIDDFIKNVEELTK